MENIFIGENVLRSSSNIGPFRAWLLTPTQVKAHGKETVLSVMFKAGKSVGVEQYLVSCISHWTLNAKVQRFDIIR